MEQKCTLRIVIANLVCRIYEQEKNSPVYNGWAEWSGISMTTTHTQIGSEAGSAKTDKNSHRILGFLGGVRISLEMSNIDHQPNPARHYRNRPPRLGSGQAAGRTVRL